MASSASGLASSAGGLVSSARQMTSVSWWMKPVRQWMKQDHLVFFFITQKKHSFLKLSFSHCVFMPKKVKYHNYDVHTMFDLSR